jgi:hypothetical protein
MSGRWKTLSVAKLPTGRMCECPNQVFFKKEKKKFYTQGRASCHQFNDTTGFFDLFLRLFTHIPSPDNHRNTRETTLAEKLCVSEREKVEYWSSVCW